MAKVVLDNVASGYDLSKINANFQTLATALENTVSRDGTIPNSMSSDLDMNGNRVINELAQSGGGFIWESAWITATPYSLNNLVSENGSSYICLANHTSGVFATDLAAGKWELLAAKGATGAGTGDMLAANNLSDVPSPSTARNNLGLAIGTHVQSYDIATAKLNTDQAWTGAQRGAIVTDNDGSFDMNASNNFICTPAAGVTLTFTNITAGQSGNIYLVNGSNYAIAKAASTLVTSSCLAAISVTGEYWISYFSPDGVNVLVSYAGDFA